MTAKRPPTKRPGKKTRAPAVAATPAPSEPDARPIDASIGVVDREILAVMRELREELGRAPDAAAVARRVGLPDAVAAFRMGILAGLGVRPLPELTPRQLECLAAVARLERRLGACPSTLEVSAEMGLCASGSRYHIARLVRLGLLTPPEMRLVLAVTPDGAACLALGSPAADAGALEAWAPSRAAGARPGSESSSEGHSTSGRGRERPPGLSIPTRAGVPLPAELPPAKSRAPRARAGNVAVSARPSKPRSGARASVARRRK